MMQKDKVILTRVDENIAERVEYITNNSKDLELTKSEVVRIILYAFFNLERYSLQVVFCLFPGSYRKNRPVRPPDHVSRRTSEQQFPEHAFSERTYYNKRYIFLFSQ
ncbi:putative uncharacterized protein [groundwater metagenome]